MCIRDRVSIVVYFHQKKTIFCLEPCGLLPILQGPTNPATSPKPDQSRFWRTTSSQKLLICHWPVWLCYTKMPLWANYWQMDGHICLFWARTQPALFACFRAAREPLCMFFLTTSLLHLSTTNLSPSFGMHPPTMKRIRASTSRYFSTQRHPELSTEMQQSGKSPSWLTK